jgi:hypothetical protein
LNLQVLLEDNDAGPDTAHQVVFDDQRSVSLQQYQKQIEGARPQLYGYAVGNQLPLAQQHAETAEFKRRFSCRRARLLCAVRRRVFAVEGGLSRDIHRHRGSSV